MQEGKSKILIVEDNVMNTVLVREILAISGYETVEVQSGMEAIKILANLKPDLILMDLHLPGMDGITATRIIKSDERNKKIPVLALTAATSANDEDRLAAQGFDGCVSKPIDRKRLLEAIEKAISESRGQDV